MNKGRGIGTSILGGERFPPTLRLPFYEGRLDSRISFTGGANRTYFDPYKVLQDSSTNAARFDHLLSDGTPLGLSDWEARTNGIRNNTIVGASAGTPGTAPTNWSIFNGGGTVTINEIGTENGIDFIEVRFNGTPSGVPSISMDTTTDIDALTTEIWTISAYMSLVAGDTTNVSAISFEQRERTEAGAAVKANVGVDRKGSLTSSLQRFNDTATFSGGGTVAHVLPLISILNTGDIDLTLRIGLPQEEQGTGASPVIKTTNAAVEATEDVPTMLVSAFDFNQSEGTFLVKANQPTLIGSSSFLIQIDDGGVTDRIILSLNSASKATMEAINSGGNNGSSGTVGAISAGVSFAAIGAYAQDDVVAGLDGTLDATPDTSADLPPTDTLTTVRIGNDHTGTFIFNGTIALIEYWPLRLWNGFLQYRTQ